MWLKGYGLDTMRMHQLRGQVVCLRQKKTTGASSGKGTTRALRSLPTLTSSPTSSMMSSACAGPYSSLWPGPAEDEETLPSGAGHSSLVMAAQPKSERQVGSERERRRSEVVQLRFTGRSELTRTQTQKEKKKKANDASSSRSAPCADTAEQSKSVSTVADDSFGVVREQMAFASPSTQLINGVTCQ